VGRKGGGRKGVILQEKLGGWEEEGRKWGREGVDRRKGD